MKFLRATWRFLGRPSPAAVLLAALAADLMAGYFFFRAAPEVFAPLNRLGLVEWSATYGLHHLGHTWWFFAFLILLGLMALNTLACTCQRLAALGRSRPPLRHWPVRLWPHLMHLALVVILASQLASYLGSANHYNQVLRLGGSLTIPHSRTRLRLEAVEVDFYSGRRLVGFRGRALSERIRLAVIEGGRVVRHLDLALTRPGWWRGWSIHLQNYHPRRRGGMPRAAYAKLVLRRDPGIRVFFLGTALFALGLVGWLWQAVAGGGRKGGIE